MSRPTGTDDAAPRPGAACLVWLDRLHDVVRAARARTPHGELSLEAGLDALCGLLGSVRERGARVWWAANGGSAALASHLSQDMLMRCAIGSSVLGDAPLLTCLANDYGYDQVYARPLSVLMGSGDLLIAVSSSGESPNVLNAVAAARDLGARVAAFSGFAPGNRLDQAGADLSIHVPAHDYGHVEIAHEALIHAVLERLCQPRG